MARIKLKNARPKAPWGAIISSAIGGLGQIWGQQKQADLQKQQLAEQRRMYEAQMQNQQMQNNAMTLNNYFSTLQPRDEYMQYPTGGRVRRKLKNAGKANRRLQVTDGGYALPVGKGLYYIPEGATHDMINESGRTGVGMTYGGTPFEVEPNELVAKSGNDAIVFSPKVGPVIAGLNPVEAVLAGYPKQQVLALQEGKKNMLGADKFEGNRLRGELGLSLRGGRRRYRNNNNTNDRLLHNGWDNRNIEDGVYNGPATPTLFNESLEYPRIKEVPSDLTVVGHRPERVQVPLPPKQGDNVSGGNFSDWFGGALKPIDLINAGVQTGLATLAQTTSRSNANDIRQMFKDFSASLLNGIYDYNPVAYTSLDTRVRNDAELAALQEEYQNEANVGRQNTASSANYLNRINELNTQRNLGANKIFDTTRASNLELRNKDAELRNQVAMQNASNRVQNAANLLNAQSNLLNQRTGFEMSNVESNAQQMADYAAIAGNTFQTMMDRLRDRHLIQLAGLRNGNTWDYMMKNLPWLRNYYHLHNTTSNG